MYNKESHPELLYECTFSASRSGGAGGQNVNKVSSKVELRFHVANSMILKDEERALVIQKLHNKINGEGYLTITSQEERSQLMNKQSVISKFFKLINTSLIKKRERKPTKPSKSSVRERLAGKKIQSEKKAGRNFRFE